MRIQLNLLTRHIHNEEGLLKLVLIKLYIFCPVCFCSRSSSGSKHKMQVCDWQNHIKWRRWATGASNLPYI